MVTGISSIPYSTSGCGEPRPWPIDLRSFPNVVPVVRYRFVPDRRYKPSLMHVGLNLIFLVPGETGGMEVAARELIPALVKTAPDVRFTAFVNREAAAAKDGPWGELLPAVTVPVNARNRIQWVLGEQLHLPRLAAREGVDLLHSLASTAPARGRFRRVVTVHDLIYARFPEAHSGIRDLGMRVLVPLAVRRSHRVIVDSQSTCRDLMELLGTSEDRIDVAPLGLGAVKRSDPLPEPELRLRLDLGDRAVVLSLSAKRPHKNLLALIGALALIPPERRPLLVLPGYATAHETELRERARHARLGRTTCASSVGSPPRSSRACGIWPPPSSTPRSTRASGCPCLRRWRVGFPSPARTLLRCRRSPATPRSCSTPATNRRSPPRSSNCSQIGPPPSVCAYAAWSARVSSRGSAPRSSRSTATRGPPVRVEHCGGPSCPPVTEPSGQRRASSSRSARVISRISSSKLVRGFHPRSRSAFAGLPIR